MYYCPCSGTIRDWRKGINMDNWEQDAAARCSDNFGELGPLLDRCRDINEVYHLGFAEYAQTFTGEAQRPTPGTGHGAASATEGANAHPGQPSPLAARASDARTRHE